MNIINTLGIFSFGVSGKYPYTALIVWKTGQNSAFEYNSDISYEKAQSHGKKLFEIAKNIAKKKYADILNSERMKLARVRLFDEHPNINPDSAEGKKKIGKYYDDLKKRAIGLLRVSYRTGRGLEDYIVIYNQDLSFE